MSNLLKLRTPAAFGALGMAIGLALTAVAQDGPVRIVQSSDHTLYLVQGASSWMLVPDQITDSDLAALTPRGELNGIIPSAFLGAPPQTAVAGAVPAAPIDLTGTAASELPGTPISLDTTYVSAVDSSTKPTDVFAIPLTGGAHYEFIFSSPNKYGDNAVVVDLLNSDQGTVDSGWAGFYGPGCLWQNAASCTFSPETDASYSLQITSRSKGQRYEFTVRQS